MFISEGEMGGRDAMDRDRAEDGTRWRRDQSELLSAAIIRVTTLHNLHEAASYDSLTCQEFSLTSFSLSSMYFPVDSLSITVGVQVSSVLTFLVFLRVIRRLEIVPPDAVVAPQTVSIRHRVYSGPERTRSVQG